MRLQVPTCAGYMLSNARSVTRAQSEGSTYLGPHPLSDCAVIGGRVLVSLPCEPFSEVQIVLPALESVQQCAVIRGIYHYLQHREAGDTGWILGVGAEAHSEVSFFDISPGRGPALGNHDTEIWKQGQTTGLKGAHCDMLVVLCSCSNHGRPANVYVLHSSLI